ncbi:MAG: beta-Ala-His dipeptidase [Enterocloster asparagiformis]|nr:beta-Ala-His dipeptidase [Enterocloster asparagiformis]
MQEALAGLEPERVFWWFDRIAQIPHGSGQEKELSDYIKEYFQKLEFNVAQDRYYNLIIRKPASAGYEDVPGVILEAHMDMVCEKAEGVGHDFSRDPIRVLRDGNRLCADGTTLGADDATGVAFALSILESETAAHPELEVVLTTGEEAGLTGMKQLDTDSLNGRVVMNLDCSDEGIVVGCAGASVVRLELAGELERSRGGQQFYSLRVFGLLGGHCGLHIGLGRGNANVILGRLLGEAEKAGSLCLARVEGGTQNGAICREAGCVFAVEQGEAEAVERAITDCFRALKHELSGADPGLDMRLERVRRETAVFSREDSGSYVSLINLLPAGVLEMEREPEAGRERQTPSLQVVMDKLPETSCNIGVVGTAGNRIYINCNCRSSYGSKKRWLQEKCRLLAACHPQVSVSVLTDYPEWEFNPHSRLALLLCREYEKDVGAPLLVERSHGGNECGIFSRRLPGADIVCMGTKIHHAHSPREWVGIDVIQKEYRLLENALRAMKDYGK